MNYWAKYGQELENAKTYADIGKIALQVQKDMNTPVEQVCGPISTGGYGSIKKNLDAFDATVKKLISLRRPMYDQVPIESSISRIKNNSNHKEYPMDLLNHIYLPLFESGNIKTVYFINDWESSFGANWEHEQCTRLKIPIIYLPLDFHKNGMPL